MEISDSVMLRNRDWDPSYLSDVFSQDFHDFNELWCLNVTDNQLISDVNKIEKYSPIVEDISMDDNMLCAAVEKIEEE